MKEKRPEEKSAQRNYSVGRIFVATIPQAVLAARNVHDFGDDYHKPELRYRKRYWPRVIEAREKVMSLHKVKLRYRKRYWPRVIIRSS